VRFDEQAGVIPIATACYGSERTGAGRYITGWIKHGPTGIIGTNRADSMAIIERKRGG
jgi:ferredoxin/flavodoxin---NADP+ reductase